MTRAAGRLIVAIGLIHLVYGLVIGARYLTPVVSEGFWNAVAKTPERQFFFWFVVFAFPAILAGLLISRMGKTGDPPPRWLGISVLAFTALCIVLLPASGFWLFVVPGVILLLASRQRSRQNVQPK